jgi:hypothetical protein
MKKHCFQDLVTTDSDWWLENTCAFLSLFAACSNTEQGKRVECVRVSEYESFVSILIPEFPSSVPLIAFAVSLSHTKQILWH